MSEYVVYGCPSCLKGGYCFSGKVSASECRFAIDCPIKQMIADLAYLEETTQNATIKVAADIVLKSLDIREITPNLTPQ